jgi:hypothetical protein
VNGLYVFGEPGCRRYVCVVRERKYVCVGRESARHVEMYLALSPSSPTGSATGQQGLRYARVLAGILHTIALLRSPTTICVSSYYTCILLLYTCLALQVQMCLVESERRKTGRARGVACIYTHSSFPRFFQPLAVALNECLAVC